MEDPMEDNKRLRTDLWRTAFVLVVLMVWVLIEASALWRAGQPSVQAKRTAVECAVPATLFCLIGLASIKSIRKQILPRSSN
jgi:hypothetical protein